MSIQNVTEPVMLDSTGQALVTKLNELKQVVQPVNPCLDIDISLPTTGWSGNGPYTYTYSNEHITSGCSVKASFLDSNSAGAVLYLNYEKVTGGVQFTADSVPTATIPIRLHILNADATSTAATTADQVSTDVISGASNVEEALGVVDGRVDTLNGKIAVRGPVYWNTSDSWGEDARKSYYIRQGNIVIVSVRKSGLTANTDILLFTLPTGYRPIKTEIVEGHDNTGFYNLAELTVTTNGEVKAHSQGTYITATIAFYTEDALPSL